MKKALFYDKVDSRKATSSQVTHSCSNTAVMPSTPASRPWPPMPKGHSRASVAYCLAGKRAGSVRPKA